MVEVEIYLLTKCRASGEAKWLMVVSRVGVIKIVINCNLITFSKVIACNS